MRRLLQQTLAELLWCRGQVDMNLRLSDDAFAELELWHLMLDLRARTISTCVLGRSTIRVSARLTSEPLVKVSLLLSTFLTRLFER